MTLVKILAIFSLLCFLIALFLNKNARRTYLLFVLYLFPLIDLAITAEKFGDLRIFEGMSFIIFFVCIKDFITLRKSMPVIKGLSIALIGSLCVGSLISFNSFGSFLHIGSVLSIFIFCSLLILELDQNPNFFYEVIKILRVLIVFSAVFVGIQIVLGLEWTFYPALNRNTQNEFGIRYPGFFHEPQKFGQFLSMVGILSLIKKGDLRNPGFIGYIFLLIAGILIFLTGSRSALLGFIVGVIVLIFFLSNKFKIGVLSIFLLGGFLFGFFSISSLMLKRTTTIDNDLMYRMELWNEAEGIVKQYPLFGVGLGNYAVWAEKHSENYFVSAENEIIFFDQPENGYLMILSETGFIGSLLFGLILLILIIYTLKNIFRKKCNSNLTYGMGALVSWLVSFNSVFSLGDRRIFAVVAILISLMIAHEIGKKSNTECN